jgi:hypothetical protein
LIILNGKYPESITIIKRFYPGLGHVIWSAEALRRAKFRVITVHPLAVSNYG